MSELPSSKERIAAFDLDMLIDEHTYCATLQAEHIKKCLLELRERRGVETTPHHGEVTIVTNREGECVAVTRTDSEHRILSVIWEKVADVTCLRCGGLILHIPGFAPGCENNCGVVRPEVKTTPNTTGE